MDKNNFKQEHEWVKVNVLFGSHLISILVKYVKCIFPITSWFFEFSKCSNKKTHSVHILNLWEKLQYLEHCQIFKTELFAKIVNGFESSKSSDYASSVTVKTKLIKIQANEWC